MIIFRTLYEGEFNNKPIKIIGEIPENNRCLIIKVKEDAITLKYKLKYWTANNYNRVYINNLVGKTRAVGYLDLNEDLKLTLSINTIENSNLEQILRVIIKLMFQKNHWYYPEGLPLTFKSLLQNTTKEVRYSCNNCLLGKWDCSDVQYRVLKKACSHYRPAPNSSLFATIDF